MQPAPATTQPSAHLLHATVAVITAAMTIAAVFLLGRASPDAVTHAVLSFSVLGASAAVLWLGLRDEPAVRAWALGGIGVTLVVGFAVLGLRSQPSMVNETVVMADRMAMERAEGDGEPGPGVMAMEREEADAPVTASNVLVAGGSFEPLEHAGRGKASIIRTAEGTNVLTLTDFRTDAGPDLEVRLVAGDPANDGDVERARIVRLGKLKGTSGNQQYELPAGIDPAEFTHAYVWCRAFSVGFTRARLA